MAKKPTTKKTAPRRAVHPSIDFIVACDSVARDPNTSKPTIYGIFEFFVVESFPAKLHPFYVFARIRDFLTSSIEIVLEDPKGKQRTLGSIHADPASEETAHVALNLQLDVESPGTYRVFLKSGKKPLKPDCPIIVKKKD